MKNVKFHKGSDGNYFSYHGNDEDVSGGFDYRFSTKNLWKSIKLDDFEVQLLINPLLNRESNVYDLRDESNKTVGYLFPISLLDSDSDFGDYRNINNYVYVAFWELLKRIPSVKEDKELFSDNFEDNVCVCVFHKASVNTPCPLRDCIHSLRMYGYSYFTECNNIKPVDKYQAKQFFLTRGNKILLKFREPSLYKNPIIDSILRALPKADNLTHRFVLLYQVIETLIEEIASKRIDEEIKKFIGKQIPCNDFQDNIKQLSSEKTKISKIFKCCEKLEKSDEAKLFLESCLHLFDLVHYSPSNKGLKEIFYSFRNQMTHSYRNLDFYQEELSETIQYFELLILRIVETYQYRND